MNDELLTIEEAANLMEIDHETVRKWIDRGLPTVEGPAGTTQIRRADLDTFLRKEGQGRSRDAATEV
ncbi:MAG TPA: helix-turn-helix domain-containing protein [Chloroflexaceae bacterium]|nr:helix-turn-helix domain-containing protein [Chloroflexaceae bacterium]